MALNFLKDSSEGEVEEIRKIFNKYCSDGSKISAIKELRNCLAVGLLEAKELIEACSSYGVDSLLNIYKPKPKINRSKNYRRISFENEIDLSCPICGREEPEDVVNVTSEGETIGCFCRKCYEFLTMYDIMQQVKRRIDRLVSFTEHLKAVKNNT